MIVVVAGPAGSGKSTLGLGVARMLGLPLLDLDTLTNPLLDSIAPTFLGGRHWNDASLRDVVRPARYRALLAALADQVLAGGGAVVVAPFTLELTGGPEWDALVDAAGGAPTVLWMRASPELLAERRAGRTADRDAHIVDAPSGTAPAVPHHLIDAVLATGQQLSTARRLLGLGRALEADSPVFGRPFRAALFDLDGTLIDSTPAVNRSWDRLGREYGFELDLLAAGHGQPAAQVVAALFPAHLVDEALARVTELEADDLDGVIALHGAKSALDALPDDSRAIVTSGTRRIATGRLQAAGITPPAVLVTFDDVTHGKPDPEPFLLAASRLGVDPADCVVFEDAPAGLAAARAAGCATVAIAGTHDASELDADLVVDGLFQLDLRARDGGGLTLHAAGA
jgi:sugar-phosphatase